MRFGEAMMCQARLINSGLEGVGRTTPTLSQHPPGLEVRVMPEFDSTLEFRAITGFPGYMIGSDGSVWSCRKVGGARKKGCRSSSEGSWHQIKTYPRPGLLPYLIAVLCPDAHHRANTVRLYVHRLVLEAFIGPCPPGLECRHLDRDPSNCRLDNLCWGTPLENNHDKRTHGTERRGERHQNSVLTEDQVRLIRDLHRQGKGYRTIARLLGIPWDNVRNVAAGRTWTHVQ
jgi:hypothetical protein